MFLQTDFSEDKVELTVQTSKDDGKLSITWDGSDVRGGGAANASLPSAAIASLAAFSICCKVSRNSFSDRASLSFWFFFSLFTRSMFILWRALLSWCCRFCRTHNVAFSLELKLKSHSPYHPIVGHVAIADLAVVLRWTHPVFSHFAQHSDWFEDKGFTKFSNVLSQQYIQPFKPISRVVSVLYFFFLCGQATRQHQHVANKRANDHQTIDCHNQQQPRDHHRHVLRRYRLTSSCWLCLQSLCVKKSTSLCLKWCRKWEGIGI